MSSRAVAGLRLAFSTLTVLPLRSTRVDRPAAAVAMASAPLVGAVLGLVLAGVRLLDVPPLVAGAVTAAAAAVLTRGLHLDGLADTVDALGSYRRGEAALEVMKKSDIGPFGVAAIGLTLLIQAAALSELHGWVIVAGYAAGRLAVPIACRRGVPAARPDGLGALVAFTVPRWVVGAAAVLVAAGAVAASGWRGPVAVAVALLLAYLLVGHAVRRFGGITGDVIGAAVEIATTAALVVLTLR